jgi:hypothetical protein
MDHPILALLADLYTQLNAAQAENMQLRQALTEAQQAQSSSA